MKRIISILCFIYVFSQMGYAQYYKGPQNKWNISMHIGMNSFFGDVSNTKNKFIFSDPFTKDFYMNRNAMYQLSLGYDILPAWNLKFNVLYGNLQGEGNDLGLKFKSFYTHEFSFINSLDILSIVGIDEWGFNVHLGAGVYSYKTVLVSGTQETIPRPNNQHFIYSFSMPFGIGFAYNFDENWKTKVDLIYRWIEKDDLDGYVSDMKKFEGFSYVSIGFQYSFNISPMHRRTNVRKHFKQINNYNFSAMGKDQTHIEYRKRKRQGNLQPVNDYNRKQRMRHNSSIHRKHFQKLKLRR
ncbi:MAG: hypothetical protein GX330_05055 [Bacteroidales bacterium]|nr:hypothetical protein [Bacteroidales bacterium]